MASLEWDVIPGFNGLDRGVLYLSDGSGVAWNGLASVQNGSVVAKGKAIELDGHRSLINVSNPTAKAALEVFTYPEEFEAYAGHSGGVLPGLSSTGLAKNPFSLSYTTEVVGQDGVVGTQYHILYNLIAQPKSTARKTLTSSYDVTMFKYDLLGMPEDLLGFKPTNYIMFDGRYLSDPDLLVLNETLYGTDLVDASLPTLQELVDSMTQIIITNNFDGTWTAEDEAGLYITTPTAETFQITEINAVYQDADTYDISST